MTVSFYLDARAVKDGAPAPVKLAIRRKGTTAYIPTELKVLPSQWNSARQQVISSNPNAKYLNVVLGRKRLEAERAIIQLQQDENLNGMTAAQIREKVICIIDPEAANKSRESKSFRYRFVRFMEHKGNDGTRRLYAFTLRKLEEFDKKLRMRSFEDITRDYLQDFESHLAKTEKKNTRNIHLRNIRAVINDAIDSGVTSSYPFRRYPVKPEATMKKALTIDQLRALLKIHCEPYQVQYRDMFLLMFMLRGINIGDLLQASSKDIKDGRLDYRRNKVGTLFSVKIEPEARAIIERYKGRRQLLNPLDSYGNYLDYLHHLNDGLKGIGRTVGKRGKANDDGLFPGISSNWARHTWATVASFIDIPKEVISKALGHSFGLSVTDIYIDFDSSKVDEANRRVLDFVLYGKDYRNNTDIS
ncbi:MAG: site-specific integrase [Bacteroidales bacterium]|nr:site-specific integrase [Bacteroidales bacterium]